MLTFLRDHHDSKGHVHRSSSLFGLGSVLVECTDEVKCNQWSQACLFERSTTVPSRPSKSEGNEARCLRLGASHQSTVLSFGRSTTFATVQLNLLKRSTLSASHSCESLSMNKEDQETTSQIQNGTASSSRVHQLQSE